MIKILFICHGNICRSPMAEFVMKDLVKSAGREDDFYIASAATSNEEIGNNIHYGTRNKLKEKQIPFENRHAVRITEADYGKYDCIIAMDKNNIKNSIKIFGDDADGKIHLLLDFTGESRDVADPWYTGDFDKTFDDVLKGCKALLNYFTR